MPPKLNHTSNHHTSDPDNEVVCPIKSADGSNCRKKCLGEKRFRSMQEHIRRAHPEYYIPKLPATKESFDLMVNSPPSERPPRVELWSPTSAPRQPRSQPADHHHNDQYAVGGPSAGVFNAPMSVAYDGLSSYGFQGGLGPVQIAPDGYGLPAEYRRGSLIPAASAAAALAQLHYARPDGEWDNDQVGPDCADDAAPSAKYMRQNYFNDHVTDAKRAHMVDPTLSAGQQFLDSQYQEDQSNPSGLSLLKSPSSRQNTLPPMQRTISHSSHKNSLTQSARKAKHERDKIKNENRKALSAEPNMYGKRWEDLIDAATSATEEDRDLTPLPVSPYKSPQVGARTPLAPFALGSQFQSYTASPLQQTLTPPPADADGPPLDMGPFPSVEDNAVSSSIDSNQSGNNFHIMPSQNLSSDSSPMFSNPVQIYCAGCRRLSILKECFACTECICGLCTGCVEALMAEQSRGRIAQCPRCRTMSGRFKQFQLDIR
ncbi:hypothetical protein E4T49_02312 [Aureobasidium sp. EXF-10728]|nr:hypothetical protein E4T49_02312 [Aureobasidium sp. EXF-10728]